MHANQLFPFPVVHDADRLRKARCARVCEESRDGERVDGARWVEFFGMLGELLLQLVRRCTREREETAPLPLVPKAQDETDNRSALAGARPSENPGVAGGVVIDDPLLFVGRTPSHRQRSVRCARNGAARMRGSATVTFSSNVGGVRSGYRNGLPAN